MIIYYDKYPFNLKHILKKRKKEPVLFFSGCPWNYPVVPALFILASLGILLNTFLEKPVEAIASIILTALGIPVYYHWKRKK